MINSLLRFFDAWSWPAAAIVLLVVSVVPPLFLGRLALRPLQRAAQRGDQPIQFYTTDFAWLLIQLQASLGLVSAYVERNPRWAFYIVLAFLGAALTAMWFAAVRAMSKAGVKGTLRRAVMILVLLPGVEATMMGSMTCCLAGPIAAYESLHYWLPRDDAPYLQLAAQAAGAILGAVAALAVASWLLRRLTIWLLAEAAPQFAPPESPRDNPAQTAA